MYYHEVWEESQVNTTPSYDWSVFAPLSDSLETVNFALSCVLGITGLVLNSLTLTVLLQNNLRRQIKYWLLISLSIVDFLSCLSAVVYSHMYHLDIHVQDDVFGALLCKVVFSRFPYYLFSAVSAWHVVMISVERYLFVIHNGS